MSVSCATAATATSTDVFTSVIEETSSTPGLTTQPPQTSVTFSVIPCTTALGASGTCIPTTVPVTTIIPGATETVQVPLIISSTITSTNVVTLFGTSCTTIDTGVTSPIQTSDSPVQTPTSTPPPTTSDINTSSLVTNPSSSSQSTSTLIQVATTSQQQTSNTIVSDNKGTNDSPKIGAIVGGAVGGFFGLIAIVALIWFILRRRRRWDDLFEKEDDIFTVGGRGNNHGPRFSLDVDPPEPKPYQYGLVGHAVAPSGAASPPHSPPLRPSLPPGAANIHHARTSSLTPLVSASNSSSRPSTGGSQHPLYPPQQSYIPPVPAMQSTDLGASTSTALTHNHSASTASFMSAPVTHAQWTGNLGSGYNGGLPQGMPVGNGIGAPAPQPALTATSDDVSSGNRSGSPTSFQETRRLQVTNAYPEDSEFGESSSAAAAAAALASGQDKKQRDGKGRLVLRPAAAPVVHVDGGRVAAAVAGPSVVAGPSSSATPGPVAPPAYTD